MRTPLEAYPLRLPPGTVWLWPSTLNEAIVKENASCTSNCGLGLSSRVICGPVSWSRRDFPCGLDFGVTGSEVAGGDGVVTIVDDGVGASAARCWSPDGVATKP